MFVTDDSEAYKQFQLEAQRFPWIDSTAEEGIKFDKKDKGTGYLSESAEAKLHVVMMKGRKKEDGILKILKTNVFKMTLTESNGKDIFYLDPKNLATVSDSLVDNRRIDMTFLKTG